jgi:predicted enzyme related to lactoylglutathione lyase
MLKIQCVTIDCEDLSLVANFWAEVLGWRITHTSEDEIAIEPPVGSPLENIAPDVLFIKVPNSKTVKNRMHFDLRPDDQLAEVARVEKLGARRADIGQVGELPWIVMADPEGNEFCILSARKVSA